MIDLIKLYSFVMMPVLTNYNRVRFDCSFETWINALWSFYKFVFFYSY